MSAQRFSKLSLYAALTAVVFVATVNTASTMNVRSSDIFVSASSATG